MANISLGTRLHHLLRRIGGDPAGDLTDGRLLERFCAGHDEAAFADLVQRHGPMVLGVCQRILHDHHAAEDAFQATFLVLARKAAALDRSRSLGSWLYTVAHNMALKIKAGAARRRAYERQVAPMAAAEPADDAVWQELHGVLDAELGRLPEKYRVPLVLCYLQGKTHEAAARELGWPAGSVAKRLTRARELLRDRLTGRGVALSAGLLATLLPRNASAALPAALVETTSRAAAGFAAGTAGSSVVASLAEGALRTMFLTKLKIAATVLLVVGLMGSGAGAVWLHATANPVAAEQVNGAPDKPDANQPEDPRIAAIRAKLALRVNLDKGVDPNTPVKDVFEFLADRYDMKFTVDTKAFAAAGLPTVYEEPTELPKMVGFKLSRVLQMLLYQIERENFAVRYRLEPDGVVIFPVKDEAAASVAYEKVELESPDPATQKRLSQLVDLDKGIDAETPLRDALEFLSDRYDVTMVIDWKAFESIGLPKVSNLPVQLAPMTRVKLETVLHLLLQQIRGSVPGSTATFVVTDQHILVVPRFQVQAVSGDGRLVASVPDPQRRGEVHVRQGGTGREVLRLNKPQLTVASYVFSPDGQRLLASYLDRPGRKQGTLSVWDTTSGKELRQFPGHWVGRPVFAADGRTVACETAQGLTLVDTATGAERAAAKWHQALRPLEFTPGGKTLVASPRPPDEDTPSPTVVVVVEAATGKALSWFPLQNFAADEKRDPPEPMTLSPDGKFLLARNSAAKLSLWEMATGEKLAYFQAEGRRAAFAPDSRLLATTGAAERTVHLWDTQTGKALRCVATLEQPVTSLAFSADGKTLLAGTDGGAMQRWDVSADRRKPQEGRLSSQELGALWDSLADTDPIRAREALLRLADDPERTLPMLHAQLQPISADEVRLIPQWITDLDSSRFAARQKAVEQLERLLELAEGDLRRVLGDKPSVEMQRRVEALLGIRNGPLRSAVRLRLLRGIETLEQIGTAEAQDQLKKLAGGAAGSLTTREATAALERLAQRSAFRQTGYSPVQRTVPELLQRPTEQVAQGTETPIIAPGRLPQLDGLSRRAMAAINEGLAWIARHQALDGHWGLHDFHTHGKCNCNGQGGPHDIAGTAFALLPFLRAGHTHQGGDQDHPFAKQVERALKWLIVHQGADGSFSGSGYEHALATICLCEAYGRTGDVVLKGPAQRAVNCCVAWQHKDGGFRYTPRMAGDLSVGGWFCQALYAAELAGLQVPHATWTRWNTWLDSVATPEGSGYGYMQPTPAPTMTAVGLLCRTFLMDDPMAAGKGPRSVGLQKGLEYLRKLPPSPNFRNIYYYYYATRVVHHMAAFNPEAWEQWNPRMRDMLIDSQDQGKNADRRHQKGSWSAEGDARGGQIGRLGYTSLALLTLMAPAEEALEAAAPATELTGTEVERFWTDLTGDGGIRPARQALRALTAAPRQSVPFLKEHVRPVAVADPKVVARWIAALDDARFEVRQQAEAELEQLGEPALPALNGVLRNRPALEVRQRVEKLLARLDALPFTAVQRQGLRAIGILERIGTPEARQALQSWASGAEGARLTRAASASLERLAQRPPAPSSGR